MDAGVLARFGQSIQPEPRPWKDEETQALTAFLQRRRPLITMLTAEKNRLDSAHRLRCRRISARRWPGWNNASRPSMTTSRADCGRIPSGASKTLCCGAFPGSAR
ncbi:MAG: hypothetical protein HC889_15120 [Synechococcaceae cyanobacterium SM1_2_3]|nr:hypothetical protein [Synechococcaceae cyanobacterium SM1_2_3]